MAILSNGKFYGFLCSVKETGRQLANGVKEYVEDFVSGFAGHGWKIWEYVKGKWMLEIDSIRVRGQFTVFEMLISKVRAIIGAQAITQGCGKIKKVSLSEDGTAYLITLEDKDMSFMEHDFIRCQEFKGEQRTYHVEIESVNEGVIRIPLSEFDENESGFVQSSPMPGDDIVQFGNSQNKVRQSAIYMHADETGQPAIDVMSDLDSKNWTNCVKVRVGGEIPGTNGLKGFYCENGMIKCADKSGTTLYQLNPDGSGFLAKGNIEWDKDGNGSIFNNAMYWDEEGFHLSSGIKIDWDMIEGSPDWINQWTANGTTIGGRFVASPTGFFGKKDSDTGQLTGILMGEKVLVDGMERTGIFALVDDKIVFALEPEKKMYKFSGEIQADSGYLGGFQIDSYNLKNKENRDSWISIEYKYGSTERISSLGNCFPAVLGYDTSGYFKASGSGENRALVLRAMGSLYSDWSGGYQNYAMDVVGGCKWKLNKGDHWCMPGLLGIIRFECSYANNTFTYSIGRVWGNGIPLIRGIINDVDGRVVIVTMDMGHSDYSVIGQAVGAAAKDGLWDLNIHIEYINNGGFGFSCWNNNKKYIPSRADLFVIGSPAND